MRHKVGDKVKIVIEAKIEGEHVLDLCYKVENVDLLLKYDTLNKLKKLYGSTDSINVGDIYELTIESIDTRQDCDIYKIKDTELKVESRLWDFLCDWEEELELTLLNVLVNREDCNLREILYKHETMQQYFIERKDFVSIFKKYFSINEIEKIEEACMDRVITDRFHLWYSDDEYYMLDMQTGMMLNYYKHLGRINTCNQNYRTREDIEAFLKLLKQDLVECCDYFK